MQSCHDKLRNPHTNNSLCPAEPALQTIVKYAVDNRKKLSMHWLYEKRKKAAKMTKALTFKRPRSRPTPVINPWTQAGKTAAQSKNKITIIHLRAWSFRRDVAGSELCFWNILLEYLVKILITPFAKKNSSVSSTLTISFTNENVMLSTTWALHAALWLAELS